MAYYKKMAEEDYEEGSPSKISKYNSGIAQIQRLDILWRDSHRHSRTGELIKWNWDLDRVWCELAGDLKEDDPMIAEFNLFKTTIGNINNYMKNKKITTDEYAKQLYTELMEKEILLRRLQNKLGKGTSFTDADEDMIE